MLCVYVLEEMIEIGVYDGIRIEYFEERCESRGVW